MKKAIGRLAFLVIFIGVATYGYFTLRRPQGIPALREKWTEIRKMEEDNAALQRENDYRRKRIEKLESNPDEQELEIRKKLKLLRPGETSFILPDQPKQGAAAPAHDDSKVPPPAPAQD
ncbi:MAG TPA: septum formation initiator family protein [Bryobacteraceae bacterium]|nr:septum formation initiator family protein [Bryobacteraceae bacterium]